MPYWIAVNENFVGVNAFCVSVVKCCKFSFGTWVERLQAFGSRALRF
jgi:hypothetical protein